MIEVLLDDATSQTEKAIEDMIIERENKKYGKEVLELTKQVLSNLALRVATSEIENQSNKIQSQLEESLADKATDQVFKRIFAEIFSEVVDSEKQVMYQKFIENLAEKA